MKNYYYYSRVVAVLSAGLLVAYLFFFLFDGSRKKNFSDNTVESGIFSDVNTMPKMSKERIAALNTNFNTAEESIDLKNVKPPKKSNAELSTFSTPKKDREVFVIEEIYHDGTLNIEGIDEDLVNSGKMFKSSATRLRYRSVGTPITINLFGDTLQGIIKKNTKSPNTGNTYVKIGFGEKGRYANIYYGKNLMKGKIYTSEGSYIFQHNGEAGFVLPIYEYKKMKNALFID